MRATRNLTSRSFVWSAFDCLVIVASSASSSGPELPPGFIVQWDVSPKGSQIVQEFQVTEYRRYRFEIMFSPTSRSPGTDELKRLREFAGDGLYTAYTKETAETDDPVIAPVKTPKELEEGIARGDYVWKFSHPSVVIPINFKIERITSTGARVVNTEKTIDTEGTEGGGPISRELLVKGSPPLNPLARGGLVRLITHVNLRQGRYRVSATTIRATTLPPNVETIFRVAAIPNTNVLKDSQ